MKTPEILEHLRKRIVSGEFAPGSKLPKRPELLAEYSVSVSAFQKCINQLIEWGFLESRGMKGICVTANPPHRSHFALVFPHRRFDGEFAGDALFHSIRLELPEFLERHPGISFEFYYTGGAENPDQSELERLRNDASLGLLAGGIFFCFVPSRDFQASLGAFPCVVISRSPEDSFHHYPLITFDTVELFRMSRETLLKLRCRRIAVLVHEMLSMERLTKISEIASDGRAFTPPEWILGLFHETGRSVLKRNLIRLLFSAPPEKRPDSLIVLNENLLPFVCDALAELGLIPGEDVMIATHGNFPFEKMPQPKIEYFVFRARDIMETCFEQLTRQNPGADRILLEPHAFFNTSNKGKGSIG